MIRVGGARDSILSRTGREKKPLNCTQETRGSGSEGLYMK